MDEDKVRKRLKDLIEAEMVMEFLFKQGFAVRVDGKVFEVVKDFQHLKEIMYDEAMKVN